MTQKYKLPDICDGHVYWPITAGHSSLVQPSGHTHIPPYTDPKLQASQSCCEDTNWYTINKNLFWGAILYFVVNLIGVWRLGRNAKKKVDRLPILFYCVLLSAVLFHSLLHLPNILSSFVGVILLKGGKNWFMSTSRVTSLCANYLNVPYTGYLVLMSYTGRNYLR